MGDQNEQNVATLFVRSWPHPPYLKRTKNLRQKQDVFPDYDLFDFENDQTYDYIAQHRLLYWHAMDDWVHLFV
jgi:hypothetical protein